MFQHSFLQRYDFPRIEINGKRHYRTPDGDFPSVTTVLGAQPNTWIDEWRNSVGEKEANRITNEALRRGTKLHEAVEEYLSNKPLNIDLITKQHLNQLKPYLNKITKIYGLELPLYSKRLKTAGTCDCIAEMNGKIHLIDFKTSKQSKDKDSIKNYWMQGASYCFMIKELYGIEIDTICIMMTNLEENFGNIYFESSPKYLKDFILLRKSYNDQVHN